MNTPGKVTLHSRLRTAGSLIVVGLLVEVFSLAWSRPIAFLVFTGIGVPIMGLGMLVFLYSLVSVKHE